MNAREETADFSRKFDMEFAALSVTAEDPAKRSEVRARLAVLEKGVSDAQLFLPAYDVRRCLGMIAELNGKLIEDNNKSRPKFSFSSKAKSKLTAIHKQEPVAAESSAKIEPVAASNFNPPATATVFSNQENTLLQPSLESLTQTESPSEVYLSNLNRCLIDLRGISPVGAVHIKHVIGSVVICGGIKGSVLIDGMQDSVLVSACRQFRMHNSTNVRVLLHVSSKPIIEDCSRLVFGPFLPTTICSSLTVPTRSWHDIVVGAELSEEEGSNGRWSQVDDFNWLRKGESPNWRPAVNESTLEDGVLLNESVIVVSDGLENVLNETTRVKF